MKTIHYRHSSLLLQEPAKSVHDCKSTPILKSESKTPLKERKSVHFADSVFEGREDVNEQLCNVYHQLKVAFPRRRTESKPTKSSRLSQPPPEDYTQRSINARNLKLPHSTNALPKSLDKKAPNIKRVTVKVNERSSSISTSSIQQAPRRMNFAFRDSSFYSKLNQFYSEKTAEPSKKLK